MKFLVVLLAAIMVAGTAGAEPLRIAVDILPPSLGNPYRTSLPPTIWTNAAMFDALTRFDDHGVIRPALATGWEKVEATTWRFTLRPGVMFHNGEPLTAEAVAVAVNYIASEAAMREGIKREIGVLKSARAIDTLTVEIATTEPAPQMARYMSGLLVGAPGAWRDLGRDAFAKHPVGTGPFAMRELGNNVWKLVAAQNAWRPTKLEGLEVIAAPEAATRASGVMAGRIHIAMALNPDNLQALETAGHRGIATVDPAIFGLSFLLNKPGPLRDVRVRRALNMAVDRERIIAALLGGATRPTGQPAARQVYGHDPAIVPYAYDPAAARALLAEAGFADGFAFTLDAAIGVDANDAAIYQQIQSDLRAIGVSMTIRTMPAVQYYNALGVTGFSGDAFPVDWQSWPIIDVTRSVLAHSCQRPVPWYCDPVIMPTLVAARTEFDDAKALELRHQLARHYHEQAPALFLYESPSFMGVSSRVRNFKLINGTHFAFDEMELSR
jgi:peptide/nickel transport system substrate-binding protein